VEPAARWPRPGRRLACRARPGRPGTRRWPGRSGGRRRRRCRPRRHRPPSGVRRLRGAGRRPARSGGGGWIVTWGNLVIADRLSDLLSTERPCACTFSDDVTPFTLAVTRAHRVADLAGAGRGSLGCARGPPGEGRRFTVRTAR